MDPNLLDDLAASNDTMTCDWWLRNVCVILLVKDAEVELSNVNENLNTGKTSLDSPSNTRHR
jgi:hypothetical protein